MDKKMGIVSRWAAVVAPLMLLAACSGGGGGGGSGGPGAGDGDGDGDPVTEIPAGLACDREDVIDTCDELQRIGALSRTFIDISSVLYSSRFSNAQAASASGAALPCPNGGTYRGTPNGSGVATMSFAGCGTPFGVVDGTAKVTSRGTNSITTDSDFIEIDVLIDGYAYAGTFSANHRLLGDLELFDFGPVSSTVVTPPDRGPIELRGVAATLKELGDGMFQEQGDFGFQFVESGASMSLLSGSERAVFGLIPSETTSVFSTFSAPAGGVMRYTRSVPGRVTVAAPLQAEVADFIIEIDAGSRGTATASATWGGVLVAPIYSVD